MPQPSTSGKIRKSPRLCQQPGTSKFADAESMGSKRRRAEDPKGPNYKNKKRKTRSKKVPNDDETNDELVNDEEDQARIKVLSLKCTVVDCDVMASDLEALRGHLKTDHGLLPLECLAQGCDQRFENR